MEKDIKEETIVEINSIKESLNKIPDTELALDILTNLESLSNKQSTISDQLKEMKAEKERLQTVNQALMLRAFANNSTTKPDDSISYNNINDVQSIIDRI